MRAKLVESMNDIITSLNDEDFILRWLELGVADGDTNYVDYTDDETFKNLMTLFCEIMRDAASDGIEAMLVCDGIKS